MADGPPPLTKKDHRVSSLLEYIESNFHEGDYDDLFVVLVRSKALRRHLHTVADTGGLLSNLRAAKDAYEESRTASAFSIFQAMCALPHVPRGGFTPAFLSAETGIKEHMFLKKVSDVFKEKKKADRTSTQNVFRQDVEKWADEVMEDSSHGGGGDTDKKAYTWKRVAKGRYTRTPAHTAVRPHTHTHTHTHT